MPYRWYKFKENYYLTRDTTGLIPVIQSNDLGTHPDDCELGAIRQMILLYFCQSYSHLPLAYGDFYPNVHYVQRPSRWVQNKKPHEQFIYSDYENDFPDEENRWRYGGFRFKQFMFNLDYSKENIHDKYLAVSQLQFKENTWFPNRLAWSETRPIQVSMSPNLKTFRPFNIFDISDNRGEIKLLYSVLNSAKGENIYALCSDDICIAMTRKRTLFDVAGNQLGVTGNQIGTSFIQEQIWLGETEKKALQDNFWQTFAEKGDECFFANYNGVFKLVDNKLIDITTGYYKQLYNSFISRVNRPTGAIDFIQGIHSVYNTKYNEYWLSFKTQSIEFPVDAPATILSPYETLIGESVS